MSSTLHDLIDELIGGPGAASRPGHAVAVVLGNEILARECRGLASLEPGRPITPDTRFGLASVSRQFAAAATLVLARRGSLDLADDVRRWLPELPETQPATRVQHLVTETSGLADIESLLPLVGIGYEEPVTHADVLGLLLAQQERGHAPGERYLRSSGGIRLLAVLLERVTGLAYPDLLADLVLRPAGLATARMAEAAPGLAPGDLAVPFAEDDGEVRPATGLWASYRTPEAAEAGMVASLDDLIAWARAFENEPLGDGLLATLETRAPLASGGRSPAGMGLVRGEIDGVATMGSTGVQDGYAACFLRVPDRRLTVIALANHDLEPSPAEVTHAIVRHLAHGSTSLPAAPVLVRALDARAGAAIYLEPASGTVVEIAADGSGLTYFSWPMALEPRADGRVHSTPEEVVIDVDPRVSATAPDRLEIALGGTPMTLERVWPAAAPAREAEALAGVYRGAALPGVTLTISDGADGLEAQTEMRGERTSRACLERLGPMAYAVGSIAPAEPGGRTARPLVTSFEAGEDGAVRAVRLSTILAQRIRLDRVTVREDVAPATRPSSPEAEVRMTQEATTERSPRMQRLHAAVTDPDATRREEAIAAFLAERHGRGPVVEPIDGDPGHRLVTYVWHARPGTTAVELSDSIWPALGPNDLAPLAGTGLWFLTKRLPAAHRGTYTFSVSTAGVDGDPERTELDPLNSLEFDGESLLELDEAPAQPWIARRPGTPSGTLTRASMPSPALGEERTYTVHTPAGFVTGEATGLLVLFDGEWYGSQGEGPIPAPVILDNLLAEGLIPPLVTVLVDVGDVDRRMRDLACHEPFLAFVADELVPAVRERYGITGDPGRTIVGGCSLGGLSAAHAAFRRPDVFGNVLSQDGSFWWYPGWSEPVEYFWPDDPEGWLPGRFAASERLPIRFFIEVGRYSWPSQLPNTRLMRMVLQMKGYHVSYSEYAGGHEKVCWRGSLADGIVALADWQRDGRQDTEAARR